VADIVMVLLAPALSGMLLLGLPRVEFGGGAGPEPHRLPAPWAWSGAVAWWF